MVIDPVRDYFIIRYLGNAHRIMYFSHERYVNVSLQRIIWFTFHGVYLDMRCCGLSGDPLQQYRTY